MIPLSVYIGYDESEAVAYHVLSRSILRRASAPVALIPIVRSQLGKVHTRGRGPLDSTDFSITRFLVPWLSGYEGVSVFMDCDFLCLADIHELVDGLDERYDVFVCKHEYTPKANEKFLGQPQTKYRRKNWSSLMVFNNDFCRVLTPEYVNAAPGLDLHQFAWTEDTAIGSIPLEWNWLIGEYEPNPDAKMLHFTMGGPWHGYRTFGEGSGWLREYRALCLTSDREFEKV